MAENQTARDSSEKKPESDLKRTALSDRHISLGAKMIPFAGWLMPVQYAGIMREHLAVRSTAGLFDLGHMGQVKIAGADAMNFLQGIVTNDVSVLRPGQAQYALLTNPRGGVIDDIIIYRYPTHDGYMVVVNASNREKDVQWMHRQRSAKPDLAVSVDDISAGTGMIAIQGPRAAEIAQPLIDLDLNRIGAFEWSDATIAGREMRIARTGYTGEDGFEIYTSTDGVGDVWDAIYEAGHPHGLVPVGLGARDTLRLEARMPLYGNELSDDIGPLEAGLGWAVKLDKGEFVGRERIAEMKASGPPRRTVGFRLTERSGAPRSHFSVEVDGREIGFVTSGAFSPTLRENIGLALIERSAASVGQPLNVLIRGTLVSATQVKTPFYRRQDSSSSAAG